MLYPWTVAIRIGLLAVFVGLYVRSDPFFLVLFVIVGFGVMLTGTGYYLDRKRAMAPAA